RCTRQECRSTGERSRWRAGCGRGLPPTLEVDDSLGALGYGVDVVGPHSCREVLPPAVADDRHDDTLVDLRGTPDSSGHDGAGGDAGEDADFGQPAGPFHALAGAEDPVAIK